MEVRKANTRSHETFFFHGENIVKYYYCEIFINIIYKYFEKYLAHSPSLRILVCEVSLAAE